MLCEVSIPVRRVTLRFVVAPVLFLFATATGGDACADWPRFLNNSFDGAADTAAEFDWTRSPEFRWSLGVGEGYGIGVISDQRYFQFDCLENPLTGELRERLRCLDVDVGETIWSDQRPLNYRDLYGYDPGPRTSPAVSGDRVVTMGVAGDLVCRRTGDGAVLWSVDTMERYGVIQNFFGVGGSPLILGKMVIVMVGGSPEADQVLPPGRIDRASPDQSALVAFDLETGEERWACGNDLASYSSPRTIELQGKQYVLLFARDNLILVDPDNGTQLWKFRHRASLIESVNAMVPVVWKDYVFISECYQVGSVLLKVSRGGYQVVWQDPPRSRDRAMRSHWATPVLIDGYLYGCSGRNAPDSDFRCVELLTGEVQWIDPRRTRSSVTRVGSRLLVLDEDGRLQVVRPDPEKLDIIAEWDFGQAEGERPGLNEPCWDAPIVADDRMLIRGDEQVLCFELRTKSEGS